MYTNQEDSQNNANEVSQVPEVNPVLPTQISHEAQQLSAAAPQVTAEIGDFDAVEAILSKMQSSIQGIKEIKKQQVGAASEVKALVAQLAEAQAMETKLSEQLRTEEKEWQELINEFKSISESNVSCD